MRTVRLRHRGETREVAPGELPAAAGAAARTASARAGDRVFVWYQGATYVFERLRAGGRAAAGTEHAAGLSAPMPGRVRTVFARAGERVERGAVVFVLEAMKMEHAIRAPRDGVVARVLVREGELVDAGAELAEIVEPAPGG